MSATVSSAGRSRVASQATGSHAPWLSTLTYRSRAVMPMSADELNALAQAAQARNRSEGITGMVIYDEGRFFQWLEGPVAGLQRVWHSVSHDSRHTDIEVLSEALTQRRCFGDWTLKLHSRGARAPRIVTTTPAPASAPTAVLAVTGSVSMSQCAQHAAIEPAPIKVDARATELARLLIAIDADAAHALIADGHASAGSFALACTCLFEPAARSLGDLWQDDVCSEFEVALGLGRLQTSIRLLGAGVERDPAPGSPVVLIAPQPGEVHLLGAALDAEVMWRAGWDVRPEFPRTDEALQALVSNTWFDALALSLSASFWREHWLPRMTETIARARGASRNPKLIVSVGGRMFSESNGSAVQVGADLNCATALQCVPAILRLRGR